MLTEPENDRKQNRAPVICNLVFSVNHSGAHWYMSTQPLAQKWANVVRQSKWCPETSLRKANVIRSSGDRLAFCCRTSSERQMWDGSVDRTETYEPLSGKVMLVRRLKWKLCANIYTGLMRPSCICHAAWATYSNCMLHASCSNMLCADTRLGSLYPIYWTANWAKQWNCCIGHTLAETRPTVKLNLDSVDGLGRRRKWVWDGEIEADSMFLNRAPPYRRRLNLVIA